MKVATAVLLCLLCSCAVAQSHRDPLNEREIEQMRDNAMDPKKRVDLILSFSRERMMAIERLRTSTKPGVDDAGRIADLLSDLAALIDELDDNLSMYNGHSEDLRRPLRHVIDTETEFQQKLKTLGENATALQKRRLAAALADAMDSLRSSTENAKTMLADQIEKKGEEKNKEKLDRQEAKEHKASESGR